ncbi:uncharacterized protein LOC127729278 [Mytilus californianus]|uniref:uncharacterized protein LOC127729278 n=1 Tax=Mytilus californianus TaxID=6549 RepID=UPI0022479DAE|nr:uncharacterized protein LOC127729278 [Mytilus californianus]
MAETNKRIEKSLPFIKDNLTHVDSVVDKLIEFGVIPLKERDSIVSKPLERDQIQSILDVVTRKKKGDAFLSALVETKNEHVADTIKSVKLSEEKETIDRSRTYIKDRNNEDDAETYDKAEKELKNMKKRMTI